MQTHVQKYYDQGIYTFTFEGITADTNDKGKVVKKSHGFPNWKQIDRGNFMNYTYNHHRALAVLTGKISNITGIDFDIREEYDKLVGENPELKNYYTVQTNKGYHIYCKYKEEVKTTTNAMNSYNGVDIRNDDAILYAPPTKYKIKNTGAIVEYKYVGGEILEFPDCIFDDLKQNNRKEEQPVLQSTVQLNETTTPHTPPPNTPVQNLTKTNEIEKLIRCFTIERATDHDDWLKCLFMIGNELGQDGEGLFLSFSKLCTSKHNEGENIKKYREYIYKTNKLKKEKLVTIASAHKWAKEDNKDLYKILFPKVEKDYRQVANDIEASKLIFEELKEKLIYTKHRLFMKHNNVWIEDKAAIDDYVLKHILSSNITRKNFDDSYIPYSQNLSPAKNVRDVLYVLIRTQEETFDIYDKFHTTTKNRLCFKDGVLDFQKNQFYKWEDVDFEIYSTIIIRRNFHEYFHNPNIAVINEIKERIFEPLFSRDTTKALHFLSRALAGHYEDKNWATYLGNRDCGKGVFYDGIEKAFEDYVKTFELGNITYERNTDTNETSRKLYWLLDYEFVRLGVSQETPAPDEHLKVRGKTLKKLAGGGDTHIARRNYDKVDTHFKIDTTFMFMGNNEVIVDDKDAYEHHIPFHSVNQFKTQDEINRMRERGESELVLQSFKIKDPTIKEKCLTEEWKNAFVYLVYQNYIDNAVSIIKEDVDDEETMSLRQNILRMFDITNNPSDYILCSIVEDSLNNSKKKIKNELTSLGIRKIKSNRRDATRDKNIYVGIKMILIDDTDNESDVEL